MLYNKRDDGEELGNDDRSSNKKKKREEDVRGGTKLYHVGD